MVFTDGETLATPIIDFLQSVERGEAASRETADPHRLEMARLPFDASNLPAAAGLALVVLMLLLAVATFVSEDLASIGTGLLVAQGRIGFFAGAAACIVGIVLGDLAIYFAGRLLGRPWLARAPLRWLLSSEAVDRSDRWFAEKGPSVIVASRFLPGTRVATYFASGLLGLRVWRFLLYLGAAVVLWVPFIVGLAALLGARVFEIFEIFARFALPGVLGLAVLGWLLFRALRGLLTRKGRRLLIGRWRRLRHWEFWPPWLFYPPVLAQIAHLALRHRSLTVFTAANPAMPAGGFVGESKAAILGALDPRYVARYTLLPTSKTVAANRAAVERFLTDLDLDFPIVLKPDVGQRGVGVAVIRDVDQLVDSLRRATGDLLVQEFVPGVELGVFYVRVPGEEHGSILSVTEKRLPEIVGDGVSTIEDLVLADERAVALAAVYFDRLSSELRLVDIGTHCRGAVFLDGRRFCTPELEAWVEATSRSFSGFYFGRYDLKAPSHESFQRGDDITVIELNGVTSEATHIYDPANSLFNAYRTLFRQWELAFEIGARNAADGAPITTAAELLEMIWNHR
jgi:membrane protein DedA with SNARE-associated domain